MEALHQLTLIPPHSKSLNQISVEVPVDEITLSYTQKLIDRMFEIGLGEQGNPKKPTLVGLAAPQIGINKRIILVGVDAEGRGEAPQLQVFINPTIVRSSNNLVAGREGCFSASRVCGIVDRADSVTIKAYDRQGNIIKVTAEGFPARIFQHEIDHLDGLRFPDRIEDPKRLHWVPEEQFGEYREHWATWTTLCSTDQWEAIKTGR